MKKMTNNKPGKAAAPTAPERTRLPLNGLLPHPKQSQYFPMPTEEQIRKLAEDMERNGQREPIHVLPRRNQAGLALHTVLDGNCRIAAAKILGWTDIEVVIRHDLKGATADEVEAIFLSFNPPRRQMSQIERCRVELRLLEMKSRYPVRSEAAREVFAAILGKSNRTADRHFQFLCAPIQIQRAHESGRLAFGDVARVGRLGRSDREKLMEAMGDEQDPTKVAGVVRDFFAAEKQERAVDPTAELAKLLSALETCVAKVTPELDELPRWALANKAGILASGIKFLKACEKIAKRPAPPPSDSGEPGLDALLAEITARPPAQPDDATEGE